MRERRIGATQVYRCLRTGALVEGPWPDIRGWCRCTFESFAAGKRIEVAVAFNTTESLVVITVMERTVMYQYTDCGLDNVWLINGYKAWGTPYGEATAVESADQLHRAIALFLVNRKPRLSGGEFRFIRRELYLSQAELAQILGNDAQSVARWEKSGRIPRMAERFLRALYREHAEGNAGIRELVARLSDERREGKERLVFEDTEIGWQARAA